MRFANAMALMLVVAAPTMAWAQGAGFIESFDGTAPSTPTPFTSPDFDVVVHSRDVGTWFQLESMPAHHGPQSQGPPATHTISSYEDSVYNVNNHVMTAIKASGYGMIYLTPNALADFSRGVATIRFDVSTLRSSTRDWIDLWITPMEDHLQLPLDDWIPDGQGHPRRGLHVRMNEFSGQLPGAAPFHWTHFGAKRFDNYIESVLPRDVTGYETVLTPSPMQRRTIEIQVSRTSLRVSMPQFGLTWVDTTFADLGWDLGVLQFGHHSYNPLKAGTQAPAGHNVGLAGVSSPEATTWHWDNFEVSPAVRFDIIKANRRFVRGSAPAPVILERPAPANASLRFSALGNVQLSFDGGAFLPALRRDGSLQASGMHALGHFSNFMIPIPEGTQQVDFRLQAEGWWPAETLVKDISVWSLEQGGTGCAGSLGLTPKISSNSAQLGLPWTLSLTNARSSAAAFCAISLAEEHGTSCGLSLSLSPTNLLIPTLTVPGLGSVTTDATGSADLTLAIPPWASWNGIWSYSQWAVADPQGSFPLFGSQFAVSPLLRRQLR